MKPGDVCLKIAGRDSNKLCIVTKLIDANYVEIDGQTRRKKCNVKHLEFTGKTLDIKEGASRSDVQALFKKDLKIDLKDTKPKESKPRPKKQHKSTGKPKQEKKEKPAKKKATKKPKE